MKYLKKKTLNLLCSVVLVSIILSALGEFEFEPYSLEIAKYRQREAQLIENASETYESLNRKVIEQQYNAYILDKAAKIGIVDPAAKIKTQWSKEGIWVPYSLEINCEYSPQLSEYIEAELGIPAERQYWKEHE